MQLAEKMIGLFDLVVSDRSKYYREQPDKVPNPASVQSIINSYSVINAAISGGASLVPGPWGMVAVIPEIAAVIRNQLAMIYDIGMAYSKSQVLNKELLAGVFLSAMGTSTGALLVMQGGKVIVRRVSLRVFQRIVMLLAGKVTQQMLRSIVSKWLPVIGAAAMAAWSNYITRQIGKKAVEILEKPIEIEAEEIEDESIVEGVAKTRTYKSEPIPTENTYDYTGLKIKALINLMKIDKRLKPEEQGYIQTLIENSEIDDEAKIELANLIDVAGKISVDFTLFAKAPDEAAGMLFDLIGLAKRDGEFHLAEKIYIKQAGKLMGISESDIEEAMVLE
jgi:uncharacterized protein (DUF697 family)